MNASEEAAESAPLDEGIASFIEEFADAWVEMGAPRLEARVLGLLLITDEKQLSSAQICALLQASAGAVSVAVRALVAQSFIRRRIIPGDRSHYFYTEEDVWGYFLQKEREYLPKMGQAMRHGLEVLPATAEAPRTRLTIAENYTTWLAGHQQELARQWKEHRSRGLRPDSPAEENGSDR